MILIVYIDSQGQPDTDSKIGNNLGSRNSGGWRRLSACLYLNS
jgi:hypothetical protein